MTCLRERLADLRPSTNFQTEFARQLSVPSSFIAAGFVSWRLRQGSMLAPALIRVEGGAEVVDLADGTLVRELERKHAELLARYGIEHLDTEHVLTTNRAITQAVSRSLYEGGSAGIRYYSHLDLQPCFALFEGRATLKGAGDFESLTDDIPELLQVASDFRLVLQRVEMSLVDVAEAEVQLGTYRLRHSRWRQEILAVHQQVLHSKDRIERERNMLTTFLEDLQLEFAATQSMPDGAERTQQVEAILAQVVAILQRVATEAESIPHFRRERDRFREEALDLERKLTSFQQDLKQGRFPPQIESEARLLLEDVRSWPSSAPPDS